MILDAQTLYSDDQAITATANSSNVIDHGVDKNWGKGVPMEILVQVTEAFATLTSLTVTMEVDDNSSFSSAKTVWSSGAIAAATMVQGYQFAINYAPRTADERYSRLVYTVGGSNATTGKIVAGVTMGAQTNVTG